MVNKFNINGTEIEFETDNSNSIVKDDYSGHFFSISDDENNILVSFDNGHIKTKNFDSEKLEDIGNDFLPYSESNIRFSVKVNCNIPDTESQTTELQSFEESFSDFGVLMLPETYTKNGKPTYLVIGCHGAGGGTFDNDSQIEKNETYQYLVANGFAVMDMNGIPQEYCTKYGVDIKNNIGSPICVQSYVKGYQWVIEHYNIYRHGCFVSGGSMGGISSTNLVLSKHIPVLAQGINCPVLDTYNHIFLHPWSSGLPKTALGIIYGLEKSGSSYVYSEDKISGYNPIVNGMQSYDQDGNRVPSSGLYNFTNETLNGQTVTEYKYHPCPLMIWHSINDGTVNYTVSKRMVKAIRNFGGQAWLRTFPSGGHAPTQVGEYLENPTGSLNYKGKTIQIKPYSEEIYLFFKKYCNL